MGVWTYALNNAHADVDGLTAGETLTDELAIQSTDGTPGKVVITVTGVNDAAVFAGAAGTVVEDVEPNTVRGTVTVKDPDGEDTVQVPTNLAGAYGTFTFNTVGVWTYALNNAHADVDGLTAGETLTDELAIQLADGTPGKVVITVIGVNDAAVFSGAAGAVTEDAEPNTVRGTVTVTDPDGENKVRVPASLTGAYGTFTFNTVGVWTYALNNAHADVDGLTAGATLKDELSIQSADGTPGKVMITVTGVNDAAVFSGTAGAVTEDAESNIVRGTVMVKDPDGEDKAQVPASLAGAYGTFTFTTAGVWTYALNNADEDVDGLAAGATLTDELSIQSADGTAGKVVITVTGANDAAVFSGAAGAVTEDAEPNIVRGTVMVTDPDGEDKVQVPASLAGAYGTFTFNTVGVWTYALNNADEDVDELTAGATLKDELAIQSADGTPGKVVITVTGANDAAVFSGAAGAVTEDAEPNTVRGTVTVTDPDGEDKVRVPASLAGAYGTFTFNTVGVWTYALNNANEDVDGLAAGATLKDELSIQSADGTPGKVVITVTGVNDAAVFSGTAGAVTEDAESNIVRGTVMVKDPDGEDKAQVPASLAGAYGTFTFTTAGVWTYALNNANEDVDGLAAGATLTDELAIQSADGTPGKVVITVTGTNDAAVFSGAAGAVTEDAEPNIVSGTVTVTDPDGEDTVQVPTNLAGAYGTFTFNTVGVWTYALNNADEDVDGLTAGATLTDELSIQSADGTAGKVVITVTGANDAAVFSGAAGAVTEDAEPNTVRGTVTVKDPDGEDTVQVPTNLAGAYGTFTFNTVGVWTYALNNANEDVDGLTAGATLKDELSIQSADGTAGKVVITVTGVNDAATIGGDLSGAVTEDAESNAVMGTVTVMDVDGEDTVQVPTNLAGAYGTFTFNTVGVWTYALNNANEDVDGLTAGATLTDELSIQSADGTAGKVVITVTGVNDAAVFSGAAGAVTEDAEPNIVRGTVTVTDPDGEDKVRVPASLAGAYGTFTFNTVGVWTYALNNANEDVDGLTAGATLKDELSIQSADGTAGKVVITVTGANDAAVFSGAAGAVTEDAEPNIVRGTVTVTDPDGEDKVRVPASLTGAYGTFTFNTVGVWTYALNNANEDVDGLTAGATLKDELAIQSADGTAGKVVITVTGANDAAVFSGAAGAVTEDAEPNTVRGTVTVKDPDGEDTVQVPTNLAGAYGTFTFNTVGVWTYALNNANEDVDGLTAGATLKDELSIQSADGTAGKVVITVTGVNDAATIGGDLSGAVTEDAESNAVMGTVTVMDVDGEDTVQVPTNLAGAYGTFTFNTVGVWTYALNNANEDVDGLTAGATLTDELSIQSADGTAGKVVITVTGANDAAVFSGAAGAVTEDAEPNTVRGTVTVTDPDGEDKVRVPASLAGAYGTFTFDTAGVWTYALNNADEDVDGLTAGATLTDELAIQSADGTPGKVVITVTGTNDAAVFSGTAGAVTEDAEPNIVRGTVMVKDPDGEDKAQVPASLTGAYGTFTFTTAGVWTYALNNANEDVDGLTAGATLTDELSIQSADGTPGKVVITVTGTNDAAVFSGAAGAVTEDAEPNIVSGTVTVTDPDGEDTVQVPTNLAGAYGTFTFNTVGVWTYALNNADEDVDGLTAGATLTDELSIQSADGTAGKVVITVTGANDAAVFSGAAGAVTEDAEPNTVRGTVTVKDPDGEDTVQVPTNLAGAYGTFTFNTVGVWTYALNNANEDVDGLTAGATLKDELSIQSADGTAGKVVITVTGVNDAATIGGDLSGAVTEDAESNAVMGTVTVMDVDGEDTVQVPTNLAGAYGTFTFNTVGVWTYALNNANEDVDGLTAGATLTDELSIQSADGTAGKVVITVTGANDAAVFSGAAGAVTEDAEPNTVRGTVTVKDSDGEDKVQVPASLTGAYGTFTFNTVGVWTYALNNADEDVDGLTAGATLTDELSIQSADGTPGKVVITVTGTNDAATIGGDLSGVVTEDAEPNIVRGTVTVEDPDGENKVRVPASLTGAYGTFTFNTVGVWTYALNNAHADVDGLTAGETLTDELAIQSTDGTPGKVVITVTGVNDAAVFAGAAGTVVEDAEPNTVRGTVTVKDPDGEDTVQVPTNLAGAYGTFTFNTVGVWTYALNNAHANVDGLTAGETLTDELAIQSADGTPGKVMITVTGVNDAAVFSGTAGAVTEDAESNIVRGTVMVKDPDGEDKAQVPASLAGAYGTFTFTTAGVWTYALNNADEDVDGLAAGATLTDELSIQSADGTPGKVVITVTGANDAAVFSGAAGAVTEDAEPNIVHGTVMVTDPDGEDKVQVPASLAGAYGTFTFNTVGVWTYALNNADEDVDGLTAGATLKDELAIQSADGTAGKVVITVTGANDAAVFSGAAGAVTEDAEPNTVRGTVTVTDPDGEDKVRVPASLAGAYGTFTFDTAGVWTYALNNADEDVDGLTAGATLTDELAIQSADGTAGKVVITVTGTNDAAVFSGTAGAVTEDAESNIVRGTVMVKDPDGEDKAQVPASLAGAYGTFTFTTAGVWTYALNNADEDVDGLAAGATLTDELAIQSADGTPGKVVITVTGTNDAAVFSGAAGAVTEDAEPNIVRGTVTVTDPDGEDTVQVPTNLAGAYGTFTFNTVGVWTYALNNANEDVDGLTAGATLMDELSIQSADGTAGKVVITVTGVNDAATIGGDLSGAVTEDAESNAVMGTVTVMDVDGEDTVQMPTNLAGAYGTFTFNTVGVWTYALNNANEDVDGLTAGATLTDELSIQSADGTAGKVVITVTGANDAAVFSGAAGAVTEDAEPNTVRGTVTVTDPDGEDTVQVPTDLAGAYGTFTFNTVGVWTYALNNANEDVDGLTAGATLKDELSIQSADGTAGKVVITVTGVNDAATIGGDLSGAVTEDAESNAVMGTVTVMDVDGEDTVQVPTNLAGAYGTFTFNTVGVWTYALNNANEDVDGLTAGATLTDELSIQSADGTAGKVVITVTGANDAAVFSGAAGAVTEDAEPNTVRGTVTVKDPDGEDTVQVPTNLAGAYGTFTFNTVGVWTYALNNANEDVDGLTAGATLTDELSIQSADGTAGKVVITVTGANDAAVFSGAAGAVTEDAEPNTVRGTVTVKDPDGEDTVQVPTNLAGAYGTFTFNTVGVWTYALNNANEDVDGLTAGATLKDELSIQSADGTAGKVVITVTGVNDAATIGGDLSGAVTEDAEPNIVRGTVTVTDPDGEDKVRVPASLTGAYGTFTFNTVGVWTYALNNANEDVDGLTAGATLTDELSIQSADGTAGKVVITVTGVNDAAQFAGTTGTVVEDAEPNTVRGTATAEDPDGANTVRLADGAELKGTYGSFTFGSNGDWSYTLDNTKTVTNVLAKDATQTDTLSIVSGDGTAGQVVITVTGANDAPTATAGADQTVVEGASVTLGGNGSDPDTGATLSYAWMQKSPTTPQVTLSNANTKQAGFTAPSGIKADLTLTFILTVTDGLGGTASDDVVITVERRDTSTVTNESGFGGDLTGAVTEDAEPSTVSGTVQAPGSNGANTVQAQTTTAGAYGSFTIKTNGVWTYALDNKKTATNALMEGALKKEEFTIRATNSVEAKVVITVTGANDAAVFAGATGAVVEDAEPNTVRGTVTVADPDGEDKVPLPASLTGAYGTFTFTTVGVWTYALNNANEDVDGLAAGATLTDELSIHSADGTPGKVVITVTGVNDAAVFGGTAGAVTEDAKPNIVRGTVTVTDPDGENKVRVPASLAGAYGTFTFTTVGVWTYALDNAHEDVDGLTAGATLTDELAIQSADGTPGKVVITVTGVNDAAVFAGTAGTVAEDAVPNTVRGTVTVKDPDGEDTVQVPTNLAGAYGTFTFNTVGVWTYALNNANEDVDGLTAGATLTDELSILSADGTAGKVVITVTGANDAAVFSGAAGAVTEDAEPNTVRGTVTVKDPDGEDKVRVPASLAGTYGTFTFNTVGVWTYTLNNANEDVDGLSAGATLTDELSIQSADGTSGKVVITVTGANDAAVFAGTAGAVAEDAVPNTVRGTVTVKDPDGEDTVQVPTNLAGAYGTFTFNTVGVWTYALNNAHEDVDGLTAGATLTDELSIQSADGTAGKVVITVAGVNDAAVFSGAAGAVTEDAESNIVRGTVTVKDSDGEDKVRVPASLAGAYGTFTFTTAGVWTYALNNADEDVDGLTAGATLTDELSIQSADGTAGKVVITVTGANDAAVFSGTAGAVTEDAEPNTVRGTVTVKDPDGEDKVRVPTSLTGAYGTFTFDTAGVWTYALNNANEDVDGLTAGATLTDELSIQSADGTAGKVVITVTGANDAAVFSGAAGAVTEDAESNTVRGTVTVKDPDGEDKVRVPTSLAGAYGTFTFDTAGVWTYALNNADEDVDGLTAGVTLTDELSIQSADGTAGKVVITVTGVNDEAVFAGTAGAVAEDAEPNTVRGTVTVKDPDGEDTVQVPTNLTGAYGTFTFTTVGVWTYALNNANEDVDGLTAGATLTDELSIQSADGTPGKVVITVTGVNDAPTASAGADQTVAEGASVTLSGSGSDPDSGAALSYAWAQKSPTTPQVTLSNANTKQASFTAPDDLTENLALTFELTVTDDQKVTGTDTVVITVTGINAPATFSGVTGAVTEDATQDTVRGTAAAEDSDGANTVRLADGADLKGTYGSFTFGSNGDWSYTLDNTKTVTNALAKDATQTDTLSIASGDGTAGQVVITVTGANDAPTASAGEDQTVAEGVSVTMDGSGSGDPDAGTTLSYVWAQQSEETPQVALSNANTKQASFTAPDDLTEDLALTFELTVTDDQKVTGTDTVVITVTGVNAPATFAGVTGAVTEDALVTTVRGTATAEDSDGANTVRLADGADLKGTYGSFTFGSNGDWSYTLDNTKTVTNALAKDATQTDTLSIASGDGTAGQVVITVTGANDAPTASAGTDQTVVEGASVTLDGSGSDPDTGTTLSYAWAQKSPTTPQVTLSNANTKQASFTAPADLAVDLTLTFTLTVTDGQSAKATDTMEITVTGVNAPATFSGVTGAVTEDATQDTVRGTATAEDSDGANTVRLADGADLKGTYGSFTFGSNGDWSYTLDNTKTVTNALAKDATQTDTLSIASGDGTAGQVVITVTGANDAPTAAAGADQTVVEGVSVTLGGSGSDPDTGATLSYAWAQKSPPTPQVTLSDANTKQASFTAPDDLTEGLELTFELTVTDDQKVTGTDTVVITVTGVNAPATFAGVTGAVTEDATQDTVRGTATADDSDGANTVRLADGAELKGTYGSFTFGSNGDWSYTLDNTKVETNALAGEATVTDELPIKAADGTAGKVVITVTGTNDSPVVEVGNAQSVSEGASVVLDGSGSSDPDNGATLSYAWAQESGETPQVLLSNANTEQASFTAPSDITTDLMLTFTLRVTDELGATASNEVAITVEGVDDAAVFGGQLTGAVTEDAEPDTVRGTVTVTDSDGANTVQVPANLQGTYGIFTIETNGAWTYELDNTETETNALAAGATVTDELPIRAADGTASEVVITVTGANDAPVADAGNDQAVSEGVSVTLDGNSSSDPDSGSTLGYAWVQESGETPQVALTNANAVQASFTAPNDLTADLTLTFTLTVTDESGGTAEDEAVVVVKGANDAARIDGDLSGTVTENALVDTASGTVMVDDSDGDDLVQAQKDTQGIYGTFEIKANGAWAYTLDNTDTDTNALVTGTSATDEFSIQAADGTEATVVITVVGANDLPKEILLSLNQSSVAEDAVEAPSITVTAAVRDGVRVDAAQTVMVSVGSPSDTAMEGTDYAAVDDLTLTIAAGANTGMVTFTLSLTDDIIDEVDETISILGEVLLADRTAVDLGQNQPQLAQAEVLSANEVVVVPTALTIIDDDVPPDAGPMPPDNDMSPRFGLKFLSPSDFEVEENSRHIGEVIAIDTGTGEIMIAQVMGGADMGMFVIDRESGMLSVMPEENELDYENPVDRNGDNVYELVVEATSGVGDHELKAQQMVTVTVRDVLEPPPSPELDITPDIRKLYVSWSEPDVTGQPQITSYSVEYREKNSGTEWIDAGHSGTDRFHEIPGLTEGSTYVVRVSAKSEEGMSDWALEMAATLSAPALFRDLIQEVESRSALAIIDGVTEVIAQRIRGMATSTEAGFQIAGHEIDTGLQPQASGIRDPNQLGEDISYVDVKPTKEQMFGGTSFAMPLRINTSSEGAVPTEVWGQGVWQSMDGDGKRIRWDGSRRGAQLGIDTQLSEGVLAGMVLSWSDGRFDYRDDGREGTYDNRMASVHPWIALSTPDTLNLWASAGLGEGELEIDDAHTGHHASDTTLATVSAGASGPLLERDDVKIMLKGEGFLAVVDVDGGDKIASDDVDASRVRIAVEGNWPHQMDSGGSVTPSLEVGIRADGGSEAPDAGMEIGGGIAFVDDSGRLSVDMDGRVLLVEGDVLERGLSGVLRYAPDSEGRGLSLNIHSDWGVASSGMEQLWNTGVSDLSEVMPARRGRVRAEAEYGYGYGSGLLTPYAGVTMEENEKVSFRIGSRYSTPSLDLSLEGVHRPSASESSILLELTLRW